MEKKIVVLLIESNRLLREGIAAGLNEQPGLKVVAAASGGETALLHVREMKPQVVLLDSSLGSPDPLGLVALMREANPEVRVILMAFPSAPDNVVEFMKLGVSGFIAKDATIADFVSTIRSVTAGTHVLPPSLVETLFAQVAELAAGQKNGAVRLTQREREIIRMIQEGLSNKEVSQRLHIATHTVKSHVHNILEKLALRTRLQIAAYAIRQKLGRPGIPEIVGLLLSSVALQS